MVLNITAAVLVLAITFIHSLFGLFSGLIDVVCAITAMCVAFGCAEPLSALAVEQGLPANYAPGVTLLVLFVLSHLILRVAADNLIRGNIHVPRALDLAGGVVCGAIIAMISVGVLVTSFLLLPFGGRVAGFSRYERTDNTEDSGLVKFERNSVWLKPDDFVCGLFGMLTSGSLKYGTTFAEVYPSYADWVTWTGNTVQPESATSPPHSSKSDGFGTKGLAVQAWWVQKGPLEARYRSKKPEKSLSEKELAFTDLKDGYRPQSGQQLIGVRLKLLQAAADSAESPMHRFRPSMLRVVGEEDHAPHQYMPRALGGVLPGQDKIRLVDVDNNFALPAGNETLVDAYFDVGVDFQPHFAEYRRFARAAFPKDKVAAAPDGNLVGPEAPGGKKDRLTGAASLMKGIVEGGTGSRTELPFPLVANKVGLGSSLELKDGKLESGRISGTVSELTAIGGKAIKEFAVPEGQGMFQMRFKAKEAASLPGKVFTFAGSVLNQYFAVGQRGRYQLAGCYAVVKRGSGQFFELYVANAEEAAASRSMLDFKDIKGDELRSGDTEIGLLFLVPPGETITGVQNQGGQGAEFKPPGYKI